MPIEVLQMQFIPAITGGHICSNVERDYFSFPVKFGDLTLHHELQDYVDLVDMGAAYRPERESNNKCGTPNNSRRT